MHVNEVAVVGAEVDQKEAKVDEYDQDYAWSSTTLVLVVVVVELEHVAVPILRVVILEHSLSLPARGCRR